MRLTTYSQPSFKDRLIVEKYQMIGGQLTSPKFSRKVTDSKIVSEYDQEIPQSQTADIPVALRGRAAQPSRDTKKTN